VLEQELLHGPAFPPELFKVYCIGGAVVAIQSVSTSRFLESALGVARGGNVYYFDSQDKELFDRRGNVPAHQDWLQNVATEISTVTGLSIFGFDVICGVPSSGHEKRAEAVLPSLWVVDVNYFPSFKGASNPDGTIADYILQRLEMARDTSNV
jgi:hypothetical protein